MAVDPAVRAALRPFEHRAVLVAFVAALALTLLVIVLAGEIAMLVGIRSVPALAAFVLAGFAVSALYAAKQRPTPLALARRIDARARLNDLLVSGIDCEGEGMPSLVRSASIAALRRASPSTAYPVEAPRHWRRWAIAAALVQIVVLPMSMRAPASRATASGMSALVLPPASGGANPAAPRDPRNPAAASSTPATTPEPSNSVTANATLTASPTRANTLAAGTSATASTGAGDRLRLAATNAADDIAAGRVPIARRAIVERYFAAIQNQRKRPR